MIAPSPELARLAATVRAARRFGQATRRRRVPRARYPKLVEVEYAKAIRGVLDVVNRALDPLLAELPTLLRGAADARGDALDRVAFAGFDVVIENPIGSVRHWIDSDGTEGQTVMRHAYGYLAGFVGADGDDVDVYLGPVANPAFVYVVHQQRKSSGFVEYDEDKAMLGWASADEAHAAYLAQYDDPRFFGGMSTFAIEDFRSRLAMGRGRKITHADALRSDHNEARRAREFLARARRAIDVAIGPSALEEIAVKFARRTSAHQRAELLRQGKAALGIDLVTLDPRMPAIIEQFVAENVTLIESLARKHLDDVGKIVTRAFTQGERAEDVAAEIADKRGISERHGKLIARDQIGTLNSQVATARHSELGLQRFTWRSMNDDRVRDEHRDLQGKTFAYDDPPSEGMPGTPIGCRCYEEPVFDDVFALLDDRVHLRTR